jgi:hypothetical protein
MAKLGASFRLGMLAVLVSGLVVPLVRAMTAGDPTVEELKAKLSSTAVGDKPHLCLQIAEKQLAEANKEYAGAEDEKGNASLTDVVAYSELARDYAIQSHKHEKQTEIAVRGMTRRLTEILHGLPHEQQSVVKDAIQRLNRIRDDLLMAMFPKGNK